MSGTPDEAFLRLALAEAHLARERGEDPFGAVIVRAGQVVAQAGSRELETGDPLAHAEAVAIRAACQAPETLTLRGCTLYSSTEPCVMCSGALKWAGIDRVVFSVPQSELQTISSGLLKPSCAALVNTGNRRIDTKSNKTQRVLASGASVKKHGAAEVEGYSGAVSEYPGIGATPYEVVESLLLAEGLAILAGHRFLSKAQRYDARKR
ncbi:nucleoside deaminase [Deinococcus radiomollis]|uniref:nucleoside deaminase n=1 Tax=Deinococcus radiomollis TaxID=468916 RepID=UPI0038929368